MTKYLVDEQTLTDIADAIRAQTGDENPIQLSAFANEISSIQGGGSMNYSTTEHEVGTWIDGSTIYEKTIYYEGGVQASSITVAHGISNFGRVVSIETSISDNDVQGQYFIIPRVATGDTLTVNKVDGTNIYFITPTQLEDRLVDWYITIRYTKASVSLLSMSPAPVSQEESEEEEAVSSSRGLMMASRTVTQLVGEESDPDQVNELVEDDENDIREQLNEVVENDKTEQEGENDAR